MMIDGVTLARAIHVLAIVHWIGGVAVVTMVVLPHARSLNDPAAGLEAFDAFERRFARQARISILLAGLAGLYMLYGLDAWSRFRDPSFWWVDLMIVVWAMFAAMIYVIEPLVAHKRFHRMAMANPRRAFSKALWMHAIALGVSVIAIGAGVLGAHGALP